jgi:hypothetical protein
MYHRMPSTHELLDLLKLPKRLTAWDKRNRILTWVMAGGFFVMFVCWALVRYDLVEKRPTALVAFSSLGVTAIAWVLIVFIDVLRAVPSLLDPATEMAIQFDLEFEIENQLVPLFRSIPAAIVLARHERLEWQLARWEKWLDVARLMGMLGPPLIFVGNGLVGKSMMASLSPSLEVYVSAALTGMLVGAIALRSGIRRLQWVSYLLKRAGEQERKVPRRHKR